MDEYPGKGIKLIVSEIDGVITDGKIMEDELGNVFFKTFVDADFEAVNELKKKYKFVFMSADNRINYNMCRRRNIPFYWAKNADEKLDTLKEIMRRYSSTPDETLYIGSLLSDRRCLQMVPFSIAVPGSGRLVFDAATYYLTFEREVSVLVAVHDYLSGYFPGISKIPRFDN